jgi:hypothetical protein
VHEVLERDFIKSRIESFLDVKLMQEEFSHTLLHSSPSSQAAAQPPLPSGVKRHISRQHPAPMDRMGIGSRKPSAGEAATRAAAVAVASAQESAEDSARRLQRVEAEQRREATRKQIRRDRRAKGASDELAVEILLPTHICPSIPPDGVSEAPAAVGRPRDATRVKITCQADGYAGRTVIEEVHLGRRMLTQQEVEAERVRLLRRQAELTAELGASELYGEAGRRFVNERHRLLFSIERTLTALAEQNVLIDETMGGGGVLAGELNTCIWEELIPEECATLRASPPPTNISVVACVAEEVVPEEELAEEDAARRTSDAGREAEYDDPRTVEKVKAEVEEVEVEEVQMGRPLQSAALGELGSLAASICEEIEAPPAGPASSHCAASARPAPIAWDISMEAPPSPLVPVTRKSSGAGGIAFEISLDDVSERPSRRRAGAHRTSPMAAAAAPASAPRGPVTCAFLEAESGAIPSGLFAEGSSLPTKVRIACANASPRPFSEDCHGTLRACHAVRRLLLLGPPRIPRL